MRWAWPGCTAGERETIRHSTTARWLTLDYLAPKIAKREISGETPRKIGMSTEPTAVEQAVSRALRDNLERLQRNSEELHQAVSDVVSACASSKPTNVLPSVLRAHTSAASLAATLEVLSRFVAVSLQSGPRSPLEAELARLMSAVAVESTAQAPEPSVSAPAASQVHVEPAVLPSPAHAEHSAPRAAVESVLELHPEPEPPPIAELEPAAAMVEPDSATDFDVHRLSSEEQELHRRANRVAKVSMQDIKMLRPEQVRLGRENKDLCIRLRDDIEKAHREYDRRFRPIMDHPVDYFYRWMVEILAEGDPHALGEYPYATPAGHR
jgi:hypothetical protein